MVSLQSEIIGFGFLKELYEKDEDFEEIWERYSTKQPAQDYHIMEGFLFKGNQLCVPRTSLTETHSRFVWRQAWRHFGRDKDYDGLEERYYCLN